MLTQIKSKIRDSITVKEQVIQDDALLSELQTLIEACIASLKDGGKVIFCGNGGSFADAQHLSAEFTARFERERSSLASVALGTNSSTLSAIGNDYGYEYVFSRELESIGQDKHTRAKRVYLQPHLVGFIRDNSHFVRCSTDRE